MRTAALALVVFGALGAWEWTGPGRAVEKLRDAAADGDTVALAEVVAFDSVRAHLRSDAHGLLERYIGSDPGMIASLGAAFGDVAVGEAIDALVTPSAIAMLARGRIDPDQPIVIDRTGINTFVVEVDDGNSNAMPLEFRRAGLGWRLVRIRVE